MNGSLIENENNSHPFFWYNITLDETELKIQ